MLNVYAHIKHFDENLAQNNYAYKCLYDYAGLLTLTLHVIWQLAHHEL